MSDAHERPAALFLFAHQDDEFGVFQRIADCRAQGLRVACAYFTDGATASATAAQRNLESLAVLQKLGVERDEVHFAGQQLGIADAQLPQHLQRAARWLEHWLDGYAQIDSLHVTAWEGGHHDHDALHALAVTVADRRGLLARTWQYALYQAAGLPGPLFRVLAPLPQNGPARTWTIPWRMRRTYLRHCLSYPSQRGTWIGLLPFVLLHYLLRGTQALQPVDPGRLGQRPHAGPLYYEKRKFFTWDRMVLALDAWRAGKC
ncbi:PIG-L deacetylase family protein [Massilia aerilata]|uniref:PIG-L deacetylase family protein n=1 Tax=Massilia aerilata TaxID=453817 RepID=A0ABW0S4P9_9BURK